MMDTGFQFSNAPVKLLLTCPTLRPYNEEMHDRLADGTRFRLLTIVDTFTRDCRALEAAYTFKSRDVVDVLRRVTKRYGKPKTLRCDNGSECAKNCSTRHGLMP